MTETLYESHKDETRKLTHFSLNFILYRLCSFPEFVTMAIQYYLALLLFQFSPYKIVNGMLS